MGEIYLAKEMSEGTLPQAAPANEIERYRISLQICTNVKRKI